jgi:hypothetical protein
MEEGANFASQIKTQRPKLITVNNPQKLTDYSIKLLGEKWI